MRHPLVIFLIIILFNFAFFLSGCDDLNKTKVKRNEKITDTNREELLKLRVMEYWNSKVNKDRSKEYDFFDPFFRAEVSKEYFLGFSNFLNYENPEIVNMKIEGNVAFVDVKIVYYGEIQSPNFGQKHVIQKTEGVNNSIWLFIDNNWFLQYQDRIADHTYAVY